MYTQEELNQLSGHIRTRWIIFAIPELALFACQIYSLTVRNEVLTTVLSVLICFFAIFFIGTQIVPLIQYRTHVSNMLNGITHTVDGTFTQFDPDESVVAGVAYRAMHMECLEESGKPYDRLFYWDREKALPSWSKGTPITVTYHDREIADVAVAH